MELSFEINEAITTTRQKLLENFDDEVREKLREQADRSEKALNKFEHLLMRLTKHELDGHAEFIDDSSFRLLTAPLPGHNGEIPLGLYELPRRSGEAHLYRLNHPLAECLLARAKERDVTPSEVHFDYGARAGKVSILQSLIGHTGWVTLTMLTVEALDQAEDYLIFAGFRDAGDAIDQEQAARLLQLPGTVATISELGLDVDKLECQRAATREVLLKTISERNSRFFEAELAKLH